MLTRTLHPPLFAAAIIFTLACAACGDNRTAFSDSAAAAVDSLPLTDSSEMITAVTPAVGPLVQVTSTDAASVRDATEFKITEENFSQFVTAAESLNVLRTRDPDVRELSNTNLAGAGSNEIDAGLKVLQSRPAVSDAITAAGLSVRDYFVMGIAIAAALRFVDDPAAAPPTPTLESNARFLRDHNAKLTRLRGLSRGSVVVSPGDS